MMIKIGVIGAGRMGRNHIRLLSDLNKEYNLIGFYDKDTINSEKVSNDLGVRYYKELDDLLDKVDACVVAVPTSLHMEIGKLLASRGIHALIEKPLCLNSKDAIKLSKMFNKSKLMIGHVESYNPAVTELLSVLKNKKIISIEANRCSPYDKRIFDTNVIMDLMIHDIGIVFNDLSISKIKKLYAIGNNKISDNQLDYVDAVIKTDDDVVISIIASRCTEEKVRTIKIHALDEYIVADLLNKNLIITKRTNCEYLMKTNYKQESVVQKVLLPFVEPLKAELLEFYHSIVEDREPKTNSKYAINTLKIAEMINVECDRNNEK